MWLKIKNWNNKRCKNKRRMISKLLLIYHRKIKELEIINSIDKIQDPWLLKELELIEKISGDDLIKVFE